MVGLFELVEIAVGSMEPSHGHGGGSGVDGTFVEGSGSVPAMSENRLNRDTAATCRMNHNGKDGPFPSSASQARTFNC